MPWNQSTTTEQLGVLPSSIQTTFRTIAGGMGNVTLGTGIAAWAYIGYVVRDTTLTRVRFFLATFAVGTQAAEIAFASTPSAPNGASQVLTKLAATGSLPDLTVATGILKNNSVLLSCTVPAGTHLWVGIRSAFTGTPTQPTFYGTGYDLGNGMYLRTTGAAALTGSTSWVGSIPGDSTGATNPLLEASTS